MKSDKSYKAVCYSGSADVRLSIVVKHSFIGLLRRGIRSFFLKLSLILIRVLKNMGIFSPDNIRGVLVTFVEYLDPLDYDDRGYARNSDYRDDVSRGILLDRPEKPSLDPGSKQRST